MTTMKKWYFSKDGKVTGPLTIKEAETLLAKDPDFYAWHPSFTQWQPVSCVEEFFDVVPTPVPPAQIPEELVQEFVQKKQRLNNKLVSIDGRIEATVASLYEFEKEISIYQRLTHNLSDEVKANITSIQQQYDALNKNLTGLKKVAEIAKIEINDIATDFDNSVAEKGVSTSKASTSIQQAPTEKKIKLVSTSKTPVKSNEKQVEQVSKNSDAHHDKSGFSGVKGIFKSVFKPENEDIDDDFPVTTVEKDFEKDFEKVPVLTQRTEGSQALATQEVESHDDDDEEDKAKRMRRRRRRR